MSPLKKKIWKVVGIVFCLLAPVAAWLAFGERGLIRLHHTELERQAYLERIAQLTEQNRAMKEEADRLRNDMDYVEGVVRRELHLVRPGEMVYRFGNQDASGGDRSGPPIEDQAEAEGDEKKEEDRRHAK